MKLGLIYMASGFSRRFGSNKLFYELNMIPMYQYGIILIQKLLGYQDESLMINAVVVSQYEEILLTAHKAGLSAVHNQESSSGITSSIHLGLNACDSDCTDYLFLVADQPYLTAVTVMNFIQAYQKSTLTIGCVCSKGRNGNPAIFSASWKEALYQLKQDKGGSKIMKEHPEKVFRFQVDEQEIRDIDTLEDVKIIGV